MAGADDRGDAALDYLQAPLYSVVLHRICRWRQPGYEPSQHLGGVLYLFLRGMWCRHAGGRRALGLKSSSWQPPAA